MKIPLSWLKDFVDIDLGLEDLAHLLTMIGLEVDEIRLVGLSVAQNKKHEFPISGLSWERDKIVVAQVNEVMPHPNADRLVLCRLLDGEKEHIVLTGAPNLYPYKGQGPLSTPLKVPYAKEGAQIYDGHQPGQVLTILKRAKIRGVESYSMICSEKELGISDEHEGVIILDADAPTGEALVDYMGDAVFDIDIQPNMARDACILGVAREIAAATDKPLRKPKFEISTDGASIKGKAAIKITNPELNPRFVLGLVYDVKHKASPYWVGRRLRLAGMRPINSVVDATNYAMLEIGEPLHAFDYDVLVERAGGKPPTIITRVAQAGEKLTTLDGVEHVLDDFNVLVTDTAGALSVAGIMGGAESEVTDKTVNVLLEGASWNYINIRRTMASQRMDSEAGYRMARGVHPEVALMGEKSCLQRMAQWSEGKIAADLVDEYPLVYSDPVVQVTPAIVRRLLGIELSPHQITALLKRLEFECQVDGDVVTVNSPPHRMDIGTGTTGQADVVEEIARMYGYDNIPATRMADMLPPQRNNPVVEKEDRLLDLLVAMGLQEVISYRLTTPEREARPYLTVADAPYVRLQNPISLERSHLRRSLLASVLETVERNIRLTEGLALFEIGPVFLPEEGQELPLELRRLAIVLTGKRQATRWKVSNAESANSTAAQDFNFFDLKGILEMLFEALHLDGIAFKPDDFSAFNPGKCASICLGEHQLGVMGELHPLVKERYDFSNVAVIAADLHLDALLSMVGVNSVVGSIPVFPPVLEDIALVVTEDIPADRIINLIYQTGGKLLVDVRLFDIFRGKQIGEGKKSLAFSLTYQAVDRTLTDEEAAAVRNRIVRRLEQELGAKLRS